MAGEGIWDLANGPRRFLELMPAARTDMEWFEGRMRATSRAGCNGPLNQLQNIASQVIFEHRSRNPSEAAPFVCASL
jgi:hypothetical protein